MTLRPGLYSPRCLYAIGAGQMNVEEHHIGFELARKPDDLLCVRRLTNHAQIKFHLQDLAKEGAKGTAILCDQDPIGVTYLSRARDTCDGIG